MHTFASHFQGVVTLTHPNRRCRIIMSNNTQNPAPIKGSFKLPHDQLRLVDGTIVRRCPTVKPLYCSRDGRFFSVHNAVLTDQGWLLNEVKYNFSPSHRIPGKHCHNGKRGNVYPIMRHYEAASCHTLIALTWIGPRPTYIDAKGELRPMEIDHLNGDIMNWSVDNLQYVMPTENCRRALILQSLRQQSIDPTTLTRSQLLQIFNAQNL